jgi:hypothetical protein
MRTKPPESHLPQLSQSLGKKTTTIMKNEIKKPTLRLWNKHNAHLYHPLMVSGTFSTDAG